MSDAIEQKETISWYKGITLFAGFINAIAFLMGVVYLTVMQGFLLGESFLGWNFSANDAFFRGWILLLSDYSPLFFGLIFLPIVYVFYILYRGGELIALSIYLRLIKNKVLSFCFSSRKRLTLKLTRKNEIKLIRRLKVIFFRNESERVVFGLLVVIYSILLFITYGFPYVLSVAEYSKKDARTIQWSAISCQTLPSKNCYCYTQTSEKTREKVYSLIGALAYQNSDNVWLVDEKGLLHILAAKHYELTRLSEEPFEFDN